MMKPLLSRTFAACLFVLICGAYASSQTLTSYPYDGLLQPKPGYTVSAEVYLDLVNDNDLPGTGNYTWTVSPTTGISGLMPTSNSESQVVTFSSAAAGKYTFSISRGGVTVSDSIVVCNLLASLNGNYYGYGQLISGFQVNQGVFTPGAPAWNIFFGNAVNGNVPTPGMGVNEQGYIYYTPSPQGEKGMLYLIAARPDGRDFKIISQVDLNGADTSDLGYVRLGVDAAGVGWILAADREASKIYLAKFITNAVAPVNVTLVSTDLQFAGADGSAQDFNNGDVAIDGEGRMLVLANNSSSSGVPSSTVIYSLDTKSASPVLTKKFQVNDNNNQPFTSAVTGVAFDSSGNVYFSSLGDGLFYIPKSTINSVAGTVNGSLIWAGPGLLDLATNYWPVSSIIPVKFGELVARKNDDDVLLTWTTYTEINLHHFEIEKSVSGIGFVKIGEKTAYGNTSTTSTYQFADVQNIHYSSCYYRIKMVDADGKVSYSPVVRINNNLIQDITVYPNPFADELNIQISSTLKTSGELLLTDLSGRGIYKRNIRLKNGANVISLSRELQRLQPGVFYLKIWTQEGNTFQKKIIRK
ncbi:MAG: T9SS type A sorting domain-containing protein [Ferruginibacter sp.]